MNAHFCSVAAQLVRTWLKVVQSQQKALITKSDLRSAREDNKLSFLKEHLCLLTIKSHIVINMKLGGGTIALGNIHVCACYSLSL